MMTFDQNVEAILDCNLTEVKDDIKQIIKENICRLHNRELVAVYEQQAAKYDELQQRADDILRLLDGGGLTKHDKQ